jgi:Peptidase family M23
MRRAAPRCHQMAATSVLMIASTALVCGPAIARLAPDRGAPTYQLPFPCGQTWTGSTRDSHSPSKYAIDFNREGDYGDLVVASSPGVVASVTNLGNTSYGRYIVIDHGHGHSSLHAHLSRFLVVAGQTVDLGQPIGLVGDSGGAEGAHLHYEQRLDKIDQPAVFDGTPFRYNTSIASSNCPAVPLTGDWNGDRRGDVGVFKRNAGGAVFALRMPDGERHVIPFGTASDVPVVGDWDGRGQTDVGVWHQPVHRFVLRHGDGSTTSIRLGGVTALPVTGDWDGDGRTDVGVWRPDSSTFVLRDQVGGRTWRQLGITRDIPVTGDWNGDSRTDIGVYDPARRSWELQLPDGSSVTHSFGSAGDLPVTGDWNGNGVTDLGVWSPATATFTMRYPGGHTVRLVFGKRR